MSSADLTKWLQFLILISCALATAKIFQTGIYKRYRALLGFLLLVFLDTLLSLFVFSDLHSPAYLIQWEIFQPVTWVFSVWVVLELYSLILEKHRGLSTLGRWIQYLGFTTATVVSLVAMVPQMQPGSQPHPLVAYYNAIERGVDCGMLVFLVVILAWISRYPVPLSRNVVVHSVVYTVLFLSNTAGFFTQVLFGWQLSRAMNTVLLAVFGLCVLAWFFLLSRKGEDIRVTVPRFTPEQEERILSQLDALNQTLLKASRH
jgi:hypothetical protein